MKILQILTQLLGINIDFVVGKIGMIFDWNVPQADEGLCLNRKKVSFFLKKKKCFSGTIEWNQFPYQYRMLFLF